MNDNSAANVSEASIGGNIGNLSSIASIASSTSNQSSSDTVRQNPPVQQQNTIESLCGVTFDYEMLTKEMFAAGYPKNDNCKGYCSHDILRRVAIICALDNVTVKGKPGQEYFSEYDIDGNSCLPSLKSGRGITIYAVNEANNIIAKEIIKMDHQQ
jgi:hypothetical protein